MSISLENKKKFSINHRAKPPIWSSNERWRRLSGELIGTFGIVFGAAGSATMNKVSGGQVTLVGAALASGLAVTAMIYALGHICNAHFNPAVTLAFTVARHFPLREVPGYILAQFGGGILAALAVKLIFGDVPGLGGNYPSGSPMQSLILESIISFFLMFVIMAVATDTRAVGQAAALAIGVMVVVAILVGGPISGASMNPARSFGPAFVAGQLADNWLYWLGPIVGATSGALTYELLRGNKS